MILGKIEKMENMLKRLLKYTGKFGRLDVKLKP
jgi:hypothetical protein